MNAFPSWLMASTATAFQRTAVALLAAALLGTALMGFPPVASAAPPATVEAATTPSVATSPAASMDGTRRVIEALEERVKQDPENFAAQNKLVGYYLRRLRETGDHGLLSTALRSAQASLAALPAEGNPGGLAALAMVEAASHNFAAARDHAIRLTRLAPTKTYPLEILGDAYLELGQYEEAAATYAKLEQLSDSTVNTETRLARLAVLHGKHDDARDRFSKALQLAQELTPASPETVAWCHWQLGETAFAAGGYAAAEQHYDDALAAVPEYLQALASLGRVRAARGDLPGAIARYERAVEIDPMPVFVAALADLYQLAGQEKQAAMQRAAILDTPRSALDARLDNRQLVLFYADHDLRADEAYVCAAREYKVRRDIYGADAVAWTALKAGKIPEAQAAIQQALALGTSDARLFYHAGMIAKATGDEAACRRYLTRALELNPHFDPLQSKLARATLTQLSSHAQTIDEKAR